MSKHPIAGSDKSQPEGARCLGACNPDEKIEVVVMLRRQNEDEFNQLMQKINTGAADAAPVSREEFAKRFGASAADVAKTEAFAKAHGLSVVRADAGSRSVVLSGTIAQFSAAFGVKLERFEHHAIGEYRGRTGPVNVPDDMKDMVTAVLGLDSRPQARPHFRFRPPFQTARSESSTSYTPLDLARLYDFPRGDGSGQCVGIIELGGGYSESDLSAYFSQLGVGKPNVVSVGVDQAKNSPTGNPNGPDGEVTLDIEIVGAIVPGATHRGVFHGQQRRGVYRRREPRDPRRYEQAIGHLDQLGRPGVQLDAAIAKRLRRSPAIRRGTGRDRMRGLRRQRLQRRRRGRPGSRRFPGVQPVCARVRRHATAGVGERDQQRSGVERRRPGRRGRRRRERRVCAAGLAERLERHAGQRRRNRR